MAKSKKAKKVREKTEFIRPLRRPTPRPPLIPTAAYSWELDAIMSARDQQIAGNFAQPARLAVSMRTDDALAVAHKNRIAPQRALRVEMVAARGARAGTIAGEAEALFGQTGVGVTRETLATINSDLANHSVAIGYNAWLPRADGSRWDVQHLAWPLEFVWWHAAWRCLVTRVDQGGIIDYDALQRYSSTLVPITHGDGTWVIYSTHDLMPWRQDAAILPAALVWAGHAFASRDWNKGSTSHGNAKIVGELPEGVPLQTTDDEGNEGMSAEASDYLDLLTDTASLDTAVGIKPFGAGMDYMINGSRAWEVWERLMLNREKAAARIYLGTDGTLGAQGGAPGVDISQLFGVATTIIQGDLSALTTGVRTGVMEPWAAVNFGDSTLTPTRRYVISDPDEIRERQDLAEREGAYTTAIQARRATGFVVAQAWVDELADKMGVPRADLASTQTSAIELAPTDLARVVTVNEARASAGVPPMALPEGQGANPDGDLTISEFSAKLEAAATATEPPAEGAPAPALRSA